MRQKSKEQAKKQLGAAIKRCRIERGMSRRDLQEATGRSYPYLSEIEAGKKAPSTEVLAEISAALGMEMHELLETAERGREPSGRVAPRESFFHAPAVAASISPPIDYSRSTAAASPAAPPPSPEDPIDELFQVAAGLPDQDLDLLLQVARRLAE